MYILFRGEKIKIFFDGTMFPSEGSTSEREVLEVEELFLTEHFTRRTLPFGSVLVPF